MEAVSSEPCCSNDALFHQYFQTQLEDYDDSLSRGLTRLAACAVNILNAFVLQSPVKFVGKVDARKFRVAVTPESFGDMSHFRPVVGDCCIEGGKVEFGSPSVTEGAGDYDTAFAVGCCCFFNDI